ncbi:MAG: hypothetical protein A4E73_02510 [Syntrophaceae bacterium PtaU1.Bin231]|nr:MAG: hypothetical protein A4E73_02510 [Syntrophaceae bacterium PtaU1.Bin231]
MDPVKVVVRYADGKVVKGYTQDFFPNKDRFYLHPRERSTGQDTLLVLIKDLKAIFFVKDFGGDPAYDERRQFSEGDKPQGRKMEVLFKDGERLVGSTLGYEPSRPGFFISPADGKSNNMRVFVVQAFVDKVRPV